MGDVNLNDLLDAAADAWDCPRGFVVIEITQTRVTIRARGNVTLLFEKKAPDLPGSGLVVDEVLRHAIATRLMKRAAQDTADARKSREAADRYDAWSRKKEKLAAKIDPRASAVIEAFETPVNGGES